MAVVNNFWLRDNKQKLGGAVIYQAKGQTLMRQLAPSISNPRTDAQMEQRVKLANLVAFYRASAKWMRGAFETKPANQSDYNAFVSANAANNNVWLTKPQVDAGNAVVAPYIISRGSLGEVKQVVTAEGIYSNLYLGNITISSSLSVAEFTAALLNNNNGLQEGDQLSVIQYIQNTSTDGNYTIVCRAYEVILSLSSTELLGEYLPVEILAVGSETTAPLGILTSTFTGGAAFIISRTQGGKILVSSSSVSLTYNNAIYELMTTTTQKSSAISSYGTNTTVFLDSNAAGAANSNVGTGVSVLAMIINGRTYSQGDSIPTSYTEGQQIIVILSTSVTYSDGGVLAIGPSASNTPVTATPTAEEVTTSNTITFAVDSAESIPVDINTTIPAYVELDTGQGDTITAAFQFDGGLG